MKDNPYYNQARLILRVLPRIAKEKRFALKGGTAINLFVRDMPRLSIDVDLTWLPLQPREETLDRQRHFLLSIKRGRPQWYLLKASGIDRLPAIQWKLINIQKMDKGKHARATKKLREVLGV